MSGTDRLIKLLGLLGSSHEGEIVNAARQIEKERKGLGIAWSDLLTTSHEALKKERDTYKAALMKDDRTIEELEKLVENLRQERDELISELSTLRNGTATMDFDINTAFEILRKKPLPKGIRNFVDSIEHYFNERGGLTAKQRASLAKIYNYHR